MNIKWMRVETPEERELLLLFRLMTKTQQKACLKMLRAMTAFRAAMQEGEREAA